MKKFFCLSLIWLLGAFPYGVWADLSAIPMVHVVSGETETVDLRLIVPNLLPPVEILGKPEGWSATTAGRQLFLQAAGRPSIGVLELADREGQKAFLPVHVTLLPLHIFIYRAPAGAASPKQVCAAGTFNGWSSSASPMSDPDGDGVKTAQETANGTSPTNPDSNGDGVCDGAKAVAGYCSAP